MTASSLEIRLLGPFEAVVGGRPAEVTGPKRHALLALLALRGSRMVPVEVLVDALWGITVVGSIVGTRVDLREVFELHAAGKTRVITELRPLDTINESIADVEAGRIPARIVFIP